MLLVLGALFVGLIPQSLAGPTSCEYDPANRRVIITSAETTTIRRSGSSNQPGPDLEFRGQVAYQECDGATIHNTDRIVFVDESKRGKGALEINQRHGPFAPGSSPESRGLSEIEFGIDMRGEPELWRGEALYVLGTNRAETIIGGRRGLKLNGDRDLDVRVRGFVNGYSVDGGKGDDSVLLDGREGTGEFLSDVRHDHVIRGNSGDDLLIGASGPDVIDSGFGDDRILGLQGQDYVIAGPGRDRILGQEGSDRLLGGGNADHVIGGAGADLINGQGLGDHLEGSLGDDEIYGHGGDDHLDGDAGRDRCEPGRGDDTKEDCEY